MSAMPIENVVEFSPTKQWEYRRESSVRSARPVRAKVRSVVRPDLPRTYTDASLRVVPDLSCDYPSERSVDRVESMRAGSYSVRDRARYSARSAVEGYPFSGKSSVNRVVGMRRPVRIEELPSSIPSRPLRSARRRISAGSSVSMPLMSEASSTAEPLFSHAMKMVLIGGAAIGFMCLMFSFGLSTAFHAGLM